MSTTTRRLGIACIGHDLELLDARIHRFRGRAGTPAYEAALRRVVGRALSTSRASVLVVHDPTRGAIVGRDLATAVAAQAGVVVVGANVAEARRVLATSTNESIVPFLIRQHARLADRVVPLGSKFSASPCRLDELRPLISAVTLAHAAALVSLSAELPPFNFR